MWRCGRRGETSSGKHPASTYGPGLDCSVDRLDIGIPRLNGRRHAACASYWELFDNWGLRNNAPINAIYFTGSDDERRLHVPSLSLIMSRAR